MAHKAPDFPLAANVWRNLLFPSLLYQTLPCELYPRRVFVYGFQTSNYGTDHLIVELWFPKGSDVRGWISPAQLGDVVELPAGSGVYYYIESVSDHAKGFANEFRVAYATRARALGTPAPLP